jgi:sugar phosphate isomerase/epimerase
MIDWIAEHGFEFVDLFLEPDRTAAEAVEAGRVREKLAEHGLEAVGHLAWYLPIGSPMPQLRKAAVDAARDYLAIFGQIGVPAVTVHAQWPLSMFSDQEGIDWQIESLSNIMAAGADLGVRIMYEPVGSPREHPENVAAILDALPDLLCHLDMGHCNLHGLDPVEMIRRFAGRLHHLHLHDNDGLSDLHLPPGAGNIDWPAVIKTLVEVGYDRTITLEVFSPDQSYLLFAKQKIEELWRSETSL